MLTIGSYERGRRRGTGPDDDRRFLLSSFAAMASVMAFLVAILAVVAVSTRSAAGGEGGASGPTKLSVTLAEMKLTPAHLEAPAGEISIEVVNQGTMPHNLGVPSLNKVTADLAPGEKAVLDLGEVPAGTYDVICQIAGHAAAGMQATLIVSGGSGSGGSGGVAAVAAAPASNNAKIDATAVPGPGWKANDPTLAPAPGGTVHDVSFSATEVVKEVAPGVTQELWTFNDSYPGPTLRGKVGDVFNVTLTNNGKMGHSIDFHASQTAMNTNMRTLNPGESLVYSFRAEYAGIWMYHCGTAPALHHIGNGMFGAVVIDPPDLPTVDQEYLFVQSELYLGPQGQPGDLAKMMGEDVDAVVFNGYHSQYKHSPIKVQPGERIRAWVLDAGPSENSSFHVVGTIFDTVYAEGNYLLRKPDPGHGGSQALALQPAQGGFVEFTIPQAGNYAIVTHKFANPGKGALGLFQAGDAAMAGGH